MSARDLARRLEISGAAVRQHLSSLYGAGLIERSSAQPTTGRPMYVYRLSSLGRRAYPKRYDVLAGELIEVMMEKYGREDCLNLVRTAAQRVARRERGHLRAQGDRHWHLLLAWLEEVFGWKAIDADETASGVRTIVVHQCPFHDVSQRYPEVCGAFFTTLIESLWGESVEHRPIGDGLRCCALEVLPEQPASTS